MRIGYFGGSFDPPHLGHLAVAKAAAEAYALDTVLLSPTAQQPLKPRGAVAPYEDRLAMVSLLCKEGDAGASFEAARLDAPRPDAGPNYTVDALRQMVAASAAGDIVFSIVGADAFLGLPRWHCAEVLLEIADWIVVSRPGFDPRQLDVVEIPDARRNHIHSLNSVAEAVSATEVRERLRAGDDCAGLLAPAVLEYIRARALYRH